MSATLPDYLARLAHGETAAPLPLNSTSKAYENARAVLSGAGRVYGFTVYSSAAAAQFILVFDRAILPSAGALATVVFKVDATDVLGVTWLPPREFSQGCVIVNSSTAPTLTIGAADCWIDAQYSA